MIVRLRKVYIVAHIHAVINFVLLCYELSLKFDPAYWPYFDGHFDGDP